MKLDKFSLIFLTFFLVLLADLLTKFWVNTTIPQGMSIALLPGITIANITNTGALFGMFQGYNTLIAFVTVFVIGLLLYFHQDLTQDFENSFFYSLLLGGIVGNLVDRIVSGGVQDFIGVLNWPFFNIADAAATIGITGIIILSIRKK